MTSYKTNGASFWIEKQSSGYALLDRNYTLIKGSFTSMMNAKCYADWLSERAR